MNKQKRVAFYLGNIITVNKYDVSLNAYIETIDKSKKNYYEPFIQLLIKTTNHKKKFKYVFGDNNISQHPTTILKSRGRGCNNGVILRCLDFNRHWNNYYNKPKDIDFDDKINKVIWRGTTTGKLNQPASRFELVTKYYNKYPNIDVGFSHICQGKNDFKKYVKGKINVTDMLKYKYIVSVEGNDKDCGLN